MPLSFIGFTLDVVGKLIIAWITLRIHLKHFQQHRVNKKDVQLDAKITAIGIAMIVIGYILKAPSEFGP